MNATRKTGLACGALVTLVAALASYTHMRELAAKHGEPWLSWLEPLSVDGLMVVASLVIIVGRRTGGRTGLAWLALVVGVLVSLLANVAAASPDLVSRLVAAWPPLSFAVAFELMLRLVRSTGTGLAGEPMPDEEKGHVLEHAHGDRGTDPIRTDPTAVPDRSVPPADRYGADQADEPTDPAGRSDEELLTELHALAERAGGTPSLTAVRSSLRVGTGRARRLLGQLE